MTEIWPILKPLLTIFRMSNVIPAISRVVRCAIDNAGKALTPMLDDIITVIVSEYEVSKDESYLWVAKKIVQVYANESSDSGKLMGRVVEKMTEITFTTFRECARLDDIPEGITKINTVVEDYFEFLEGYLTHCPNLFCQLDMMPIIVQGTIACTKIEYAPSLSSVLSFLNQLLIVFGADVMSQSMLVSKDKIMTESTGYMIVKAVFEGVFFSFPKDREVMSATGSIILRVTRVCFKDGGVECIRRVLADVVEDKLFVGNEKETFLQTLQEYILV